MILIAMFTLALWAPVYLWILDRDGPARWSLETPFSAVDPAPARAASSIETVRFFIASLTANIQGDRGGLTRPLCSLLWTMIVWSCGSLVFVRQGGLLTAGRSMVNLKEVARSAASRSPAAWAAGVVPIACIAMLATPIWAAGWVASLVPESPVAQLPLAFVAAVMAIPCGILGFGAIVAIPLAWSAIANERDPDVLDALSRGYEYLYRRPLQLVMYGVVAVVLLTIATALISGVVATAQQIVLVALDWTSAPAMTHNLTQQILTLIPIATAFALAWGLVGGVYLLIRYDAGGQQVEDLWVPPLAPRDPVPTLPT
ncbi:hypothetical protein Pla52o_51200 [Novipirellula galeiformis]|uniref:Uncharacterized protein n=2 Tax=Novipirellula galeiformis TaxID=2528004 RepID=A0A5C6C2T4_9BACT|nr:hypothetical protein Pla52o_51200 [Novipirellula galeiformis]